MSRLIRVFLTVLSLLYNLTIHAQPAFEQRARETLRFASTKVESGGQSLKYGLYHIMARFELGKTDEARSLWNSYSGGDMFIHMGGMYCYMRYKDLFTPAMRDNWKNYMLSRNHFADPPAPKNPYGVSGTTENHYMMNASGAYIASEEWPDAAFAGDLTAAQVKEKSRNHIFHSVEQIARYGLKEYDSPIYHIYYLNSYLLLHDFAKDPEIRFMAKIGADMVLATMAPEWLNGIWVASTLRGVGLSDHSERIGRAAYMYWGKSEKEYGYRGAAVMTAVSDYRIPELIYRAGTVRDQTVVPYTHQESNDMNPPSFGSRLNGAGYRKTSYIEEKYGVFSQYDGNGQLGWSEQLIRSGVIWHGGHLRMRPPFSSGTGDTHKNQVLQHKGTLIAVARQEDLIVDKKGISQEISENEWNFVQVTGRVYLAYRKIKSASQGSNEGWVIETAAWNKYNSLEDFKTYFFLNIDLDTTGLSNVDPRLKFININGDVLEIEYHGSGGVSTDRRKINAVPVNYANWPYLNNPFMQAEVGGNKIRIFHKGDTLTYNLLDWIIEEKSLPKPDPAVTSIDFELDDPENIDSVVVRIVVKNIGKQPWTELNATSLDLYLNDQKQFSFADVEIPKHPADSIVLYTPRLKWQAPATGYRTVTAVLNIPEHTNETSKLNNSLDKKFTVQQTTSRATTFIASRSIQVYPNPVADYVIIESAPNTRICRVEIIDITGKRINLPFDNNTEILNIDTSTLKPGMYFINVSVENGRVIKKLMINK